MLENNPDLNQTDISLNKFTGENNIFFGEILMENQDKTPFC